MIGKAAQRLRDAFGRGPAVNAAKPTSSAQRDATTHVALEALLSGILESATALHLDGSFAHEVGPYVSHHTYEAKSSERLIHEVFDPSRNRLLDFGCGAGAHRKWIESIGFRWHGVDYLEGVADAVVNNVKAAPDVSFYDGKILPFEEASFDVVHSMLAFEHIQHIDVTFGELSRVLKPGGSVIGQVAYLEQMHDYSTFNFTPYGMKLAAERNGLQLVSVHPKHDAFSFLLRRLLIMTGSADEMPMNAMLGPEGLFHRLSEEAGERLGLSIEQINLLRLQFCTHFVFHVKKPGGPPPRGSDWVQLVRDAGSEERAAGLVDAALADTPDDLRKLVDVGILARDKGASDAAMRVFAHILTRDPSYAFAHYEQVVTHLLAGRHDEALRASEAHPAGDRRNETTAARILYIRGERQAGDRRLQAITEANAADPDLQALREFGSYCEAHPRDTCLEQSRALEAQFVDAQAVAALVSERLATGEGFSLIRLGDGEGAFLPVSNEDDALYPHLYAYNREDRARVWFAGELDIEQSGFREVMRGLLDVVKNADVVGAPYTSWVQHEYSIASITGITTLVNAQRSIRMHCSGAQRLTRQTVHLDLQQTGLLSQFLRNRRQIGLISCHSQLPSRLQSVYGIGKVDFYKLPGEKLMGGIIGADAVRGVHYPDVFQRTLEDLDRPLDGELFLVAGGILGKFYCDRIKQSGGVALDVGSLVDAWVGASTRPGYELLASL